MENCEEWSYRCEGNAGIVVSNRKSVLRLIKLPNEEISTENNSQTAASLKKAVLNQLSFANNVIRPLMIRDYIVPMKMVEIDTSFVKGITMKVQSLRPVQRIHKSIPPPLSSAIEMPDLCFLPSSKETLSIEIKPKWGFLPTVDDIFEVKKHVCRYCLQQVEKVTSGKCKERSYYCPIDLFSGCRERMAYSIAGLIKNPQNNCRVFKDGKIILSESGFDKFEEEIQHWMNGCFNYSSANGSTPTGDVLTNFIYIIVDCLLHAPKPRLARHEPQLCKESKCHHVCSSKCSSLPSKSVLSGILDCQMLDKDLTLHQIFRSHTNASNHFSTHIGAREQSRIDGPFNSDWLSTCEMTEIRTDIFDIKKFLFARSAKDCSIIVSLSLNDDSLPYTNHGNNSCVGDVFFIGKNKEVMASVTVIDLDVKKFDKIPFYYEEDVIIVKTYQELSAVS